MNSFSEFNQILNIDLAWNSHKSWKFRKNRARDTPLWGVYIQKFRKIYFFRVL